MTDHTLYVGLEQTSCTSTSRWPSRCRAARCATSVRSRTRRHRWIGCSSGCARGVRACRVLRGGAMRLWSVPPPERPSRGELPGDRAVADPAPAWGSGEDQPARQHHPGAASAGRGADLDLGTGRGARGDAGPGSGARRGDGGSDALPPAHRRLPAAPGDRLSGQAVDQEASRLAGSAGVLGCGAPANDGRAPGRARSGAGARRPAGRAYRRARGRWPGWWRRCRCCAAIVCSTR